MRCWFCRHSGIQDGVRFCPICGLPQGEVLKTEELSEGSEAYEKHAIVKVPAGILRGEDYCEMIFDVKVTAGRKIHLEVIQKKNTTNRKSKPSA